MTRSSTQHFLVAALVKADAAAWDSNDLREAALATIYCARQQTDSRVPNPLDPDTVIAIMVEDGNSLRMGNIFIEGTTVDQITSTIRTTEALDINPDFKPSIVFIVGSRPFCARSIHLLAIQSESCGESWTYGFICDLYAASPGRVIWAEVDEEDDVQPLLNYGDFEEIQRSYLMA